MKIALILATPDWRRSYSPVTVVESQIRMLQDAGFEPCLIGTVGSTLPDTIQNTKFLPCLPPLRWTPTDGYGVLFRREIRVLRDVLLEELSNRDILICHDVMYKNRLLALNCALRQAQKIHSTLKLIHWTHSPPSILLRDLDPIQYRLQRVATPNSLYVAISEAHEESVREAYNVEPQCVFVVNNPGFSVEFLGLTPAAQEIVRKTRSLQAEAISIFPTALSRVFKQPAHFLFAMAALKQIGMDIRAIFANADATSNNEKACLLYLKWLGEAIGLKEENLFFTSTLTSECSQFCSGQVIRDLFLISNIFIHPSAYESWGLTLTEAASTGNLCILNNKIPTFKEIAHEHALYFDFDDLTEEFRGHKADCSEIEVQPSDYLNYWNKHKGRYLKLASNIKTELYQNKSIALQTTVRNRFNERSIAKEQFLPLINAAINMKVSEQ